MTTISLTESELEKIISSLLFSSSVNVTFKNADPSYWESLKNLAKSLKDLNPEIKLEHAQFIKEENYEDPWTVDIYENFKDNLEVITFENV
jgi:hypothetical protein